MFKHVFSMLLQRSFTRSAILAQHLERSFGSIITMRSEIFLITCGFTFRSTPGWQISSFLGFLFAAGSRNPHHGFHRHPRQNIQRHGQLLAALPPRLLPCAGGGEGNGGEVEFEAPSERGDSGGSRSLEAGSGEGERSSGRLQRQVQADTTKPGSVFRTGISGAGSSPCPQHLGTDGSGDPQ